MRNIFFILGLGLTMGCAHRSAVMTSPRPVTAAADLPPLDSAVHLPVVTTVTVKKGDSLWRIAEGAMESPFMWPELWHANRDYITDPDWIEIGQEFEIPEVPADRLEWTLSTSRRWPKRGYPPSSIKP